MQGEVVGHQHLAASEIHNDALEKRCGPKKTGQQCAKTRTLQSDANCSRDADSRSLTKGVDAVCVSRRSRRCTAPRLGLVHRAWGRIAPTTTTRHASHTHRAAHCRHPGLGLLHFSSVHRPGRARGCAPSWGRAVRLGGRPQGRGTWQGHCPAWGLGLQGKPGHASTRPRSHTWAVTGWSGRHLRHG